MAENLKTPKKKRRIKPAQISVREQRNKAAKTESSTFRRAIRQLGSWLAKPFVWLAGLKIWRSPVLRPVRFIFKILGYIFLVPYLKASFRELRQVTWPSFRQTNRLTLAVLLFAIFFGAMVAAIDFGFDKLFEELILN